MYMYTLTRSLALAPKVHVCHVLLLLLLLLLLLFIYLFIYLFNTIQYQSPSPLLDVVKILQLISNCFLDIERRKPGKDTHESEACGSLFEEVNVLKEHALNEVFLARDLGNPGLGNYIILHILYIREMCNGYT